MRPKCLENVPPKNSQPPSQTELLELPYPQDAAALFARIQPLPRPVFLDSCHSHYADTRYSLFAAEPRVVLSTRRGITTIQDAHSVQQASTHPLKLLREALGTPQAAIPGLPFTGGAMGYFGYDLGRCNEYLPSIAHDDLGMPEMDVGIYDWVVVIDHQEKRAVLAGKTPAHIVECLQAKSAPAPGRYTLGNQVRSNMDQAQYQRAFQRVQAYIHDGDCYQVNLARRFEVDFSGDPWALYQRLRRLSPAPFAAYLETSDGVILSNSPERFLRLQGDEVLTTPIKGTRPRSADMREDEQLAQALRNSPKDQAENLMIVDLLRNDLGKNCRPGSIQVPQLFELQSFALVHHLVSSVTGHLKAGKHATDLLRGCFPGGSITGAPKLRAMEIIEELEPYRRGVYCGAIGYLGFDGGMDTNIAIRTLVIHRDRAYYCAGGGLVADSNADAEYAEILDKAEALFRLLV